MTSIVEGAFSGCSRLEKLTLPFVGSRRGNSRRFGGLTDVSDVSDADFGYIFGWTFVYDENEFYTRWSYNIPSSLKKVVITDETVLGYGAFYGCSGLTSVTIPSSVTSIGEEAFYGCSGLTSVTIPDGVTRIGRRAFYGCSGLTSVTIPNSVTDMPNSMLDIPGWAFSGCNGVTEATVPGWQCGIPFGSVTNLVISEGTKSIGYQAFSGCSSLTSLTIPNSVTNIGEWAFYGCRGLTSLTIPDSVTSIGRKAFYGCSGLTSVTIPNSVTEIGEWAFCGCSGLTSVTIPNSVTGIAGHAFDSCSGLTSVTIPSSVKSIGYEAFAGCSGLTSVTIPDSVTSIENEVFEYCSGLTHVTIPDSVKSIGGYAFQQCTGLKSVTIPSSVTSIGEHAFDGCSGLKSVYVSPGDAGRIKSLMAASGFDVSKVGFMLPVQVVFAANGGTVAEGTRTVGKGKAVGTLPKPTRTGYTFKGWYTKKSGGTKIKTTTKVTKNVTYYAQWAANKYTIKFNANGGKGTMKALAATYGKTVALRANAFKRTYWTFLGWAKTKGATEVEYKNKQKVKNLTSASGKTVTLYAVWRRNTYTVKFNANGGTGEPLTQTMNCGAKTALATNGFTRAGFRFAGWTTKKGGKVVYKNAAAVKDLAKSGKSATLYTVWYPESWAVGTFKGEGTIGGSAASVTLTVGSTGSISGKFVLANKKAYPFKAASFTEFTDGALRVATTIAYGKKTCELDIAVAQDGEAGATVAELLVVHAGAEYGRASLE